MKRLLTVLLVTLAAMLALTGCQYDKYDDDVARCVVANGRVQVVVVVTRNPNATTLDITPPIFEQVCSELRGALTP